MNHKYGFHCNRTGTDILGAFKRIKPAVVKVLDPNVDFLTDLRAAHPDVFIIGRIVVSLHEQERFEQDPVGEGRAFADRLLRMEASSSTFQGRPLLLPVPRCRLPEREHSLRGDPRSQRSHRLGMIPRRSHDIEP